MKKLFALGMSVALFAFSMAGCSGTTESTAQSASASKSIADAETSVAQSASQASEAQSSEAAQSGGLDAIVAAGKLVMMTNATFAPFEYMTSAGVVGVDAELAQKVADKIGVKLEIVDMNFDLLTESLKKGKGDLVAAGMSITEDRQKQVDFSVPYVDTTLLIVVPEGSEIAGPADLNGKTISVQESTTSDLFLTDSETVEPKEILRFKNAVDAGTAVMSGQADVAVIDEMTAKNIVEAADGKLVLLQEPLGTEQYAMAVAKGNAELLAVMDEVLSEAVAADEVNALIAKHMQLSQE